VTKAKLGNEEGKEKRRNEERFLILLQIPLKREASI